MNDAKHTDAIGTPAPAQSVLSRLVGDCQTFAERNWGCQPVVFRSAGRFSELLSARSIIDLVERSARRPHLRMVRDGVTLPAHRYTKSVRLGGTITGDVADSDRIGRELAAGATLVLQSLESIHPPLRSFTRDLQAEIGHPVQANAYLSPPNASALARHSDGHDVFVVQLEGAKAWDVDGLGLIDLSPGDVVYIPRGCAHSAATNQHHSLHLTIGVLSVTYRAVIRRAIDQLAAEFDRPLPLGFATESARTELAAAIGEAIATGANQLLLTDLTQTAKSEQDRVRRLATPTSGLQREIAILNLTDATPISIHRDATVSTIDNAVEIKLGERWVRFPLAAAPALDALVSSDTVTIGDLAGLDAASRLVLVRRLLREGVVDLVPGRVAVTKPAD